MWQQPYIPGMHMVLLTQGSVEDDIPSSQPGHKQTYFAASCTSHVISNQQQCCPRSVLLISLSQCSQILFMCLRRIQPCSPAVT